MVISRLAAAAGGIAFLLAISQAQAATARAAQAKRELTPLDALATVRVMQNQLLPGQPVGDFSSPDSQRYLIRLAYGDAQRNGVWMDLLTGPLSSLDASAHLKRCAHLFTTGLGSTKSSRAAEVDATPGNAVRWLDPTHIAFLWSDAHAVRQILSVDLTTCKHSFITQASADIFSFAAAPNGTLLYDAQLPADTTVNAKLWAHGFTVGDSSTALSMLQGHFEDASASDTKQVSRWFIRSGTRTHPLKIDGNSIDLTTPFARDLSISSSGRYAVTSIGTTARPPGWEQYANPFLQAALTSTDKIRFPVRYTVVDLNTRASHMLWNSPATSRGQVQWSPNDDTLLLAPTYLPVENDSPAGLSGNAAAEIDARTGAYRILPIDLTDRTVLKVQWLSAATIQIVTTDNTGADPRIDTFVRNGDAWHATTNNAEATHASSAPIRIEARESLNTPPQIFAVDTRTSQSKLILDPNPRLLDNFRLGRVERLSGTLPTGQQWVAQLIYPADYQPGSRYPLVIQSTYGVALGAEEFSLDGRWGAAGMGLGPSETPAYPGQLLASRNIAVLILEVLHPKQDIHQAEDFRLAYEALSRQLIDSGMADPDKIALDGFSQNGYWVEYTLAHTEFSFAAAIAGDNYEPSYLQSALGNWRAMDEKLNGAPAFGAGIQEWLKNAPGFNAEHIHSPLLILAQSDGPAVIVAEWEIYSRLRYLHKPAQIYAMPRADHHPSHIPQNPQQIIAVQEMTLDWLSFWLTGREDSNPEKREQYARWRAFRAAQTVADSQSAKGP